MGLLSRHILIVTGKGGVGKSTVAAGLAERAAKKGKRVLLVELGEESFYAPFFGLEGLDHRAVRPPNVGFEVARWDTESCLREYVLHYLKVEGLFRLFFENKVMKTFMNVAPALKELAILGKLTSGERKVGPEFHYDLVVVDGYSTGHMLALLRAPKGMMETIRLGPMGHHSSQIYKVLTDSKITSYAIVTLPDELPSVEAVELHGTLVKEFAVAPQIFLNRVLRSPVDQPELKGLRDSLAPGSGLANFVRYLLAVQERYQHAVERLKRSEAEVFEVPLILGAKDGHDLIRLMAEELPE